MAELIKWDQIGERFFEAGCDHGVLYEYKDGQYTNGVAWNGLTSVSETPSGAEDNSYYADNIKYFSTKGAEEFAVTVNCYTTPPEWEVYDGTAEVAPGVKLSQQYRKTFGLSYRTKIGSDTDGTNAGYKIHLVYGGSASPSERTYDTIGDTVEPIELSYEVSTTPVTITTKAPDGSEYNATALITIDSRTVDKEKLAELEAILYGDDSEPETPPRLPLPDEIMAIFSA